MSGTTKWNVTGVWKADGHDAAMTVDAPNQRAAESIASQRGMAVEQCIPATTMATPVEISYQPAVATRRVQTIQATSKRWKLMQVAGFFACLAAIIMIVQGSQSTAAGPSPAVIWGVVLLVSGIFVFCLGRVLAWWFNG